MQNKTEEKKSSGSTVLADDGFYFGIGAFETIAVEEGIPQLLAGIWSGCVTALHFSELTRA